jgi:TRAP-type C4-dicarboxylate transport system permease small subunit
MGFRLFSSRLDSRVRAIYRIVLAFFVVVLIGMIWPVVAAFSRVEPLVLGLPFFLFYLTVLLVGSFLVLLSLYLWEGHTGTSSDPDPDPSGETRL